MFDRGWTILRIRGIPIRLHFTLLLFLPYVAFVAASQFSIVAARLGVPRAELRLPPLAWGAILAVGLFIGILAHELAHSLVAIKNGVKVKSITLMMLGGVSRIEGDLPRHEAWMAFAGPLMSFLIAAVSYGVYWLFSTRTEVGVALLAFAITNAFIGAFNLLPAFPMDGGRVLRGLLAGRMGRERATRVAVTIGKGMAILFGLFGLVSFNLLLVLIAVFVYAGASAEQARASAMDIAHGIPVAQIMTDRLGDAFADESALAVAERLLRNNLIAARVHGEEDGARREIGVVTAWDLAGPVAAGLNERVGNAVRGDVLRVRDNDEALRSVEALATGEANVVIVVDASEHTVGLITPAEVQRALALISAVNATRARR